MVDDARRVWKTTEFFVPPPPNPPFGCSVIVTKQPGSN